MRVTKRKKEISFFVFGFVKRQHTTTKHTFTHGKRKMSQRSMHFAIKSWDILPVFGFVPCE